MKQNIFYILKDFKYALTESRTYRHNPIVKMLQIIFKNLFTKIECYVILYIR